MGSAADARLSFTPMKILVLDDNPTFLEMMRVVLGVRKHQVILASDGDQAIALLRESPFELAIIDLIMPGKDGLATITEVRRDFPGLPIIAVSGDSPFPELTGSNLAVARLMGADLTLQKPFAGDEVFSAVEQALQRNQVPPAAPEAEANPVHTVVHWMA